MAQGAEATSSCLPAVRHPRILVRAPRHGKGVLQVASGPLRRERGDPGAVFDGCGECSPFQVFLRCYFPTNAVLGDALSCREPTPGSLRRVCGRLRPTEDTRHGHRDPRAGNRGDVIKRPDWLGAVGTAPQAIVVYRSPSLVQISLSCRASVCPASAGRWSGTPSRQSRSWGPQR